VYRDLLDRGVEAELARDLIGRVRRKLEADELDDPEAIQSALKREISGDISVADPLRTDSDDTLLLPFVGPTGVGKTTTMAKLAAYFSVEEGQNVGFITFDTYRLAAVEQLRCYADILQVPVEAVMSGDEFQETLEEFKAEADIVFVDTAGRSQFDDDKISELESIINSEKSVITHLVVDATSRTEDIDSILKGFKRVGYDRIVVSKVDETLYHGTVYNLASRSDAPLSYFTNGQDVPDDLSRLDSEEIADLILGEDLESFDLKQPVESSSA
jgi:flagellar biosynthesis protein FlhF